MMRVKFARLIRDLEGLGAAGRTAQGGEIGR
jgi:hypothetical protein